MSGKTFRTLKVHSRQQWRDWLKDHHDSESEVWLVFHKLHTTEKSIAYDDAVEEALCFGWIDSLVKRLDDDRYARKFTLRKPDSRWSAINRQRYANLKARGLLAGPGSERAPTERTYDAPRPTVSEIPPYIEKQLKADARAWGFFQRLAPSYRRHYIGWIDSAKQEETKQKTSSRSSHSAGGWSEARSEMKRTGSRRLEIRVFRKVRFWYEHGNDSRVVDPAAVRAIRAPAIQWRSP